ncbi:MAG: MFS transporter [Alphaproteobacteria bacterium]|nr:MAG: MFS transporter [Alphaproteobacteria bacterium]
MALLALSALLLRAPDLAFGILLLATAALGFGFGATVMALNTYSEAFFPAAVDRAVLVLNALLGVGTALAPVLVAAVLALGAWWLLPVAVACVFVLIFVIAAREPLRAESAAGGSGAAIGWTALPRRFWLYAASVFVYGILETLNGNWAILYLTSERGVSARGAAFALAAFWVMVTLGRVAIAITSRLMPARLIYAALPIALFLTFQIASHVHGQSSGIIAFGLAGLACSAFLPLSISFGGKEYPELSALMAGGLIAFYQLGYGVAAFGIGPLHGPVGLALATIFAAGSLVAVPLVLIAYFITRRRS